MGNVVSASSGGGGGGGSGSIIRISGDNLSKRTKKEIIRTMSMRRTAWDYALEMVSPIIEDQGVENYELNGNFLVKGSTMTKVDQNLHHIIDVAEWLLEPIEGA